MASPSHKRRLPLPRQWPLPSCPSTGRCSIFEGRKHLELLVHLARMFWYLLPRLWCRFRYCYCFALPQALAVLAAVQVAETEKKCDAVFVSKDKGRILTRADLNSLDTVVFSLVLYVYIP